MNSYRSILLAAFVASLSPACAFVALLSATSSTANNVSLSLITASASLRRSSLNNLHNTILKQSSSDDEEENTNAINIAIITKGTTNNTDDDDTTNNAFRTALQNHPFCKMTGIQLTIDYLPVTKTWSKENISILQNTDIACFSSTSVVKRYLKSLDLHLEVDPNISSEDRRALPNKPDLVADIIGGIGSGSSSTASLMAACPNTEAAKECLDSGRWTANHIYYPKDGSQPVELKAEVLEEGVDSDLGDDDKEEEEQGDVDVEVWAASVMQAAGDVMERKFWGGGW